MIMIMIMIMMMIIITITIVISSRSLGSLRSATASGNEWCLRPAFGSSVIQTWFGARLQTRGNPDSRKSRHVRRPSSGRPTPTTSSSVIQTWFHDVLAFPLIKITRTDHKEPQTRRDGPELGTARGTPHPHSEKFIDAY